MSEVVYSCHKPYIGSSKSVTGRKTDHLCNLRNGKRASKRFKNAWNKYGEKNFRFEVLEYCDENIRVEREQSYLDKYYAQELIASNRKDRRFWRLTYNTRPKAESNAYLKSTKKTKKKVSAGVKKSWVRDREFRMDTYRKRSKWILIYSFPQGEYLNQFQGHNDTVTWLEKETGITKRYWTCIRNICNGKKQISQHGYTFRWKTNDDYPRNIKQEIEQIFKDVDKKIKDGAKRGTQASIESNKITTLAYNRFTGLFVKEFAGGIDADKEFGFPEGTAAAVASGRRRYAFNYIFKYKESDNYPLQIEPIISRKTKEGSQATIEKNRVAKSIPIICKDLNGNFVKEFASQTEVKRELGANGVGCVLSGKFTQSKGYTFQYKDPNYKTKKRNKNRN